MKQVKKRKSNRFIAWIIAILSILAIFIPVNLGTASADSGYSDAVIDLQKDETFDVNDYPIVDGDTSMQVIQIAESINNELVVYVYQPSATLKASSINLATGYKNNSYTNYKLIYINNQEAIYKYIVYDFKVTTDIVRYYEISSIFRPWNEKIDEKLETGEIIEEVSYSVGKQYKITADSVECQDIELIQVTDKYVGFTRYIGGYNYWGTSEHVDSHFIAFNTDKQIDKLLEADVYFQTQNKTDVVTYGVSQSFTHSSPIDNYSYMTSLSSSVFDSDYTGWFNSSYEWQRIQTVNEFVESEDFSKSYDCGLFNMNLDYELSEDTKSNIKNCKWVLRFYESTYTKKNVASSVFIDWTCVSNVSLLRLRFETSGRVYNLGVIDNKQTGTETPDNEVKVSVTLNWWKLLLLFLTAFVVLMLIFSPTILLLIFKSMFKGLSCMCKGIWWVITSPLEIFEDD